MSVSIYYTLIRDQPLSESERAAIARVLLRFDLNKYTDDDVPWWNKRRKKALALGETFTFYGEPLEPGEVLDGSTKLPGDDVLVFEAARYWGALLGEVAAAIDEGEWRVHVDDIDLHQDPGTGAFTFPG